MKKKFEANKILREERNCSRKVSFRESPCLIKYYNLFMKFLLSLRLKLISYSISSVLFSAFPFSSSFFFLMDVISVFLDVGIKSPFQRRKPKNTILLKKQVKFTDDMKCSSDNLTFVEEKEKDDSKVFVENDPLQGWLSLQIFNELLIDKFHPLLENV